MEDILAKLVGMRTLTQDTPANTALLDYVDSYLTRRGMHVQRHTADGRGSLIAYAGKKRKAFRILLAAHADVASGSDAVFELRKADGKLYGRGVYDMKFAIAGYMQLADDMQEELAEYDIGIMVTTDEETGGQDGINGVKSLLENGYRADICVLPDSAAPGWDIERLAKGVWRFDLHATGTAGHSSRPWLAESASVKLIAALHELQGHFTDHGPLTDTLNVAVVRGGTYFNEIPTGMSASIEIRLVHDESFAKNQALLAGLCEKYGLTIQTRSFNNPLMQHINHPLAQAYMDAVKQVTGRRPEGVVSMAASDAEYFIRAGIPCIISCPAGGGHHGEEEWIDHAQFLQFPAILRSFVTATAGPVQA